jgi:hypothetical protein
MLKISEQEKAKRFDALSRVYNLAADFDNQNLPNDEAYDFLLGLTIESFDRDEDDTWDAIPKDSNVLVIVLHTIFHLSIGKEPNFR